MIIEKLPADFSNFMIVSLKNELYCSRWKVYKKIKPYQWQRNIFLGVTMGYDLHCSVFLRINPNQFCAWGLFSQKYSIIFFLNDAWFSSYSQQYNTAWHSHIQIFHHIRQFHRHFRRELLLPGSQDWMTRLFWVWNFIS